MAYNKTIQLGSLTLAGAGANTGRAITRRQVDGSLKQVDSTGYLSMVALPGRTRDWEIQFTGTLQGTNKDADYTTLNSYNNGQPRRYDDGKISGDFCIVTGSLQFDDTDPPIVVYRYSLTLIQFQQ